MGKLFNRQSEYLKTTNFIVPAIIMMHTFRPYLGQTGTPVPPMYRVPLLN